jgi:hypothetical protein
MTLQISDDNICRINNKKCQDNKCCSINNLCGEGINYCNTNDLYNGDNAINKHNILLNNEKKYIYDNDNNILLSKNGRCGIDLTHKAQIRCNDGLYCNNYSFCDKSNNNVLQLNINNTPVSTQKYDGANTSRDVESAVIQTKVSLNGKCGLKNNKTVCPLGECCSKDGECGTSRDHCYISHAEYYENDINLNDIGVVNKMHFSGKGGMEEYQKKADEKLQNLYDANKITLTKNLICGFNSDEEKIYKCPPEQCCSKNNICTLDLEKCDLENEKTTKLNGIKSIEKYINNKLSTNNNIDCTTSLYKCPDEQCCSKEGKCGYGSDFCSVSNNKKENNGTNALEKYNFDHNVDFCGELNDKIFKCDTNDCCFRNKCGTGYEYCELADPSNNYHGNNALKNYKKNRVSTDGTCRDKICPSGECCSKDGLCGKGDSYCNNMNSKFNGFKSLQYKYDRNNFVTDSSLNICGIKNNQIYRCNPGYCCLKNGTCSLDCSNSFVNIHDNDISDNITFFINNDSKILQLKINELKDINSKFLNITVKSSTRNYAIRHSNKKKYYNDEIFELINELLNKEYTRNKLNGDNAIINYINKKILNTYENGKIKTSETNNCYVDYKNNVNYRCMPFSHCNYKNNTCNLCNDKTNKTINGKILNNLDGKKHDLIYFILFLILLSFLVYYFINKT